MTTYYAPFIFWHRHPSIGAVMRLSVSTKIGSLTIISRWISLVKSALLANQLLWKRTPQRGKDKLEVQWNFCLPSDRWESCLAVEDEIELHYRLRTAMECSRTVIFYRLVLETVTTMWAGMLMSVTKHDAEFEADLRRGPVTCVSKVFCIDCKNVYLLLPLLSTSRGVKPCQ